MGSFSTMCGLSGMTIHGGQRALVFALLPTSHRYLWHYKDKPEYDLLRAGILQLEPCPYVVSNEGAGAHYLPALLPWACTYDDYGRFKLDKKDPLNFHLAADSKYFGMDMQELLDKWETAWRGQEEDTFESPFSLMYIRRDAWDSVQQFMQQRDKYMELFPNSEILKVLGLKLVGETTDKRYKDFWVSDQNPLQGVASDGEFGDWVHVEPQGSKWRIVSGEGCTLNSVLHAAAKGGIDLEKGVQALMTKPPWYWSAVSGMEKSREYSALMFEIKNLRAARKSTEEDQAKTEDIPPTFLDRLEREENIHNGFNSYVFRSEAYTWSNAYHEQLHAEDTAEALQIMELYTRVKMASLFMYCTGRVWMPTITGPQFGEPEYALALGNILSQGATADLEEMHDDDDDEDDDE
jgi:hypothetical protein